MNNISSNRVLAFCAIFGGIAIMIASLKNQSVQQTSTAPVPVANPAANTEKLQPSSGKLEIVQYEWRGIIVQDRGKHTSASILTDDVFWQWRFDGDDSRIYDFNPTGYKPGSHRTFPDKVKLIEWRVKPGQKLQKATIVWSILDD
jgi:hypothetical protein